ncbi:hypothetical protein NL676_016762 [Syzygium grande]|nr:hypothetical protein NL676_016762 [Syzygium grande]
METLLAFPRIFVAVLLLSGTCTVMVPHANAQKRCQELLDPNGCSLYNCQQACYQKHTAQQPRGECLANSSFEYRCACFFDC